jgi:hypothetical protein
MEPQQIIPMYALLFTHFSDLSTYYSSAQDYSSYKKNGQIRANAFAKTNTHLSMA